MTLLEAAGRLLPALDRAFPTDMGDVLLRFLADEAGVRQVVLFLADYDLVELRALPGADPLAEPQAAPLTVEDAKRAYDAQAPVSIPAGDATDVYLPVSLRAERLGVLGVRVPDPVEPSTLLGLEEVATTTAYVLFAAGRYTDLYERARRRKDLALPAEMQWSLLPVRSFSCGAFTVAGQLMPAYEVGGDTFDYAVEPGSLVLTVTDAMGHGLRASLLSSLAVHALRNGRRRGSDVAGQLEWADRVLHEQFGGDQFVTGIGVSVDLATGLADVVNAGHPDVYRVRGGAVAPVGLGAQLPMGLFPGVHYAAEQVQLEPGDRYVFVSDGVLEAAPEGEETRRGEEFGEQRLQGVVLATAEQPPHEAVRILLRAVGDYQQGALHDDATVLCLDWHGPPG